MPNQSGKAYGLTILSPLKDVDENNDSVTMKLRKTLFDMNQEDSPMSKVPNTYLSRFYILDDVFFENYPHELENLKSKYLVFTSNFHGDLDTYLDGMFDAMEPEIKNIWQGCYGFDSEKLTKQTFKTYIKKCQVETTFYFDGSTDDSLDEQLKSLYLKQEFSKFVYENAHKSSDELLESFKKFADDTNPLGALPTWRPGVASLEKIVDHGGS